MTGSERVNAGALLNGSARSAGAVPAARGGGAAFEWDRQRAMDPERVPARMRAYVRRYLEAAREIATP